MQKSLLVAAVFAWTVAYDAPQGMANQVGLDVAMANATLLADKKQTTYLKVGLTGFELASHKQRTPVNVTIVLDKSGSMSGQKIVQARNAAIRAIERLAADDIVSVIAYDSTVKVIVPATKLTDKQSVIGQIRQINSGGSTALFAGVSKGAAELRKFFDHNRVNRIILLSDGLANVGPKSPSELGELGASLNKEGIAVSTLGLGLDYNEDLMVKLAQRSGGNHHFIENAADLVRIFNYEFDDVLSVVAQEVNIMIDLEPGIRPVRVLNTDAEINGQQVITNLSQLYASQEKHVLLEVEVPATAAGKTIKVAKVRVSYANMATNKTDELTGTVNVSFSASADDVAAGVKKKVLEASVLLIANERNKLATAYRDQGRVEEAKRLLFLNSQYLEKHGKLLDSFQCTAACELNRIQASSLDDEKSYHRTRKEMRELQLQYDTQQLRNSSRDKP
jgi:Ca-activated chloride channel family protein